MLLGLIFRESAKEKRSITSWRAESKKVLPTHTGESGFSRTDFIKTSFTGETQADAGRPATAEFNSWKGGEKAGYGFGRQGEKAAGLRGFLLQRPEESLPRYASPIPPAPRGEEEEEHQVHHVKLQRSPSNVSSTSSFASPYHESQATSGNPPAFRSSPTAL
ncbi:hypothetical protein H0H92_004534 [Tricholoma furcatifolium]|nr:hypothetical protein H0H92_004534 [Tricholoma furcatifolium]